MIVTYVHCESNRVGLPKEMFEIFHKELRASVSSSLRQSKGGGGWGEFGDVTKGLAKISNREIADR